MIVVTRIQEKTLRDKLRKYAVLIDGKTQSYGATPGKHTIQTKPDWMKSNVLEFTVGGNQDLKFESYVDHTPAKILKIFSVINKRDYMRIRQVS